MIGETWLIPTVLGIAGLAAEGVTSYRFIQGLKKHPVMRAFFGNPTLVSEGSLIDAYPTNKRLYTRDYLSCRDPGGIAFCDRHRLPMLVGYALGMFCIAVALLILFTM